MLRMLAHHSLDLILAQIDFLLAEETRRKGCSRCNKGVLHSARFPRKPRCSRDLPEEALWRWSFCCSRCRRRTTPPSVRFLARRVWPAPVVVLLSGAEAILGSRRAEQIRRRVGVARRTLKRWKAWWQTTFPGGDFWRWEQARFAPPAPQNEALPGELLNRFGDPCETKTLVAVLRFLLPISTASHLAGGAAS